MIRAPYKINNSYVNQIANFSKKTAFGGVD